MKKQKDIKHIWSILSESSVVDQQTNSLSIHKVLEQLNINLSPKDQESTKDKMKSGNGITIPFPFQIISLWQNTALNKVPTADVEIELFDFSNLSLQKINFKFSFEKDKPRMRTIINSPSINITGTGLYLFKIRLKESEEEGLIEIAEIPLEVRVNKTN